jgi:hypothetical protein
MTRRQPTPERMCEDRFTYKKGDLEIENPSTPAAGKKPFGGYQRPSLDWAEQRLNGPMAQQRTFLAKIEQACRDARRGNVESLCQLLREEDVPALMSKDALLAIANLIERAKFRKRRGRPSLNDKAEVEAEIIRRAKKLSDIWKRQNGRKRLPNGKLEEIVDEVIAEGIRSGEWAAPGTFREAMPGEYYISKRRRRYVAAHVESRLGVPIDIEIILGTMPVRLSERGR